MSKEEMDYLNENITYCEILQMPIASKATLAFMGKKEAVAIVELEIEELDEQEVQVVEEVVEEIVEVIEEPEVVEVEEEEESAEIPEKKKGIISRIIEHLKSLWSKHEKN